MNWAARVRGSMGGCGAATYSRGDKKKVDLISEIHSSYPVQVPRVVGGQGERGQDMKGSAGPK